MPKPKVSKPVQTRPRVGAPKKPGALDKVLYVRADQALLDRLDAYANDQNKDHPGRTVSRADAARELLISKLTDLAREAAFS